MPLDVVAACQHASITTDSSLYLSQVTEFVAIYIYIYIYVCMYVCMYISCIVVNDTRSKVEYHSRTT